MTGLFGIESKSTEANLHSDAKEEQAMELEALEAIFVEEFASKHAAAQARSDLM